MKSSLAIRLSDSAAEQRLDRITQEFLSAVDRGQEPDIEQLAASEPALAEIIRQVFPALVAMRSLPLDLVRDGGAALGDVQEPRGTLGDFRILREIGRGGMGIVYKAEQVSLSRRVALKVLPFAAVLDERQLARFKNEARAAATLHHTNIVPVFSVGCERGVHYYAMQFIEGQTLAQLIAEMRGEAKAEGGRREAETSEFGVRNPELPGTEPHTPAASDFRPPTSDVGLPPSASRLPPSADTVRDAAATIISERSSNSPAYWRTVARLGIQAAEALQHAHDVGIVHRDIKPSNLLVNDQGHLWIADFGLARVGADANMTLTGDLVGTLRYMSPEQASGKPTLIDHRSDIYSLGATLYELLGLHPVFEGEDRQQLLRQVTDTDPSPPRRHNRAIPADLQTIVLKALEKNPVHRYATAQELADDLRRWLEDKPIAARRPSIGGRARKWSRRHKALVATGASFALLSVIGLAVGMWCVQFQRAAFLNQQLLRREAELTNARGRSVLDRTRTMVELDQRQRADATFRDAITILADSIGQFPEDLAFRSDHLAAQMQYAHFLRHSERDDKANVLCNSLVAPLESLNLGADVTDPQRVFYDLGRCYFHVGEFLFDKQDHASASLFFRRGANCFARIAPDHRDAHARCLVNLGECLNRLRRTEHATIVFRKALPLLEDWDSTFTTRLLAGTWSWTPYPNMFAEYWVPLHPVCTALRSTVNHRLGNLAEAADLCQRAAYFTNIHTKSDEARFQLSRLCREVANLVGEDVEAELTLPATENDRTHRVGFDFQISRALSYALRHDTEKAYDLFELTLFQSMESHVPVRINATFGTAVRLLGERASVRLAVHQSIVACKYREAAGLCDRFVKVYSRDRRWHWLRGFAYSRLEGILYREGKDQEAVKALDEAIASYRQAISLKSDCHRSYADLAWLLCNAATVRQRDPARALELAATARRLAFGSFTAMAVPGMAYYRLGRFREAATSFGEFYRYWHGSQWNEPCTPAGFVAAMTDWRLGHTAEANDRFQETVDVLRSYGVPDDNEELQRLRAEAEQLMGIDSAQDDQHARKPPESKEK